jgi:hypothetical protein
MPPSLGIDVVPLGPPTPPNLAAVWLGCKLCIFVCRGAASPTGSPRDPQAPGKLKCKMAARRPHKKKGCDVPQLSGCMSGWDIERDRERERARERERESERERERERASSTASVVYTQAMAQGRLTPSEDEDQVGVLKGLPSRSQVGQLEV